MASLLRLLPAPFPASTLTVWVASSASAPTHPPDPHCRLSSCGSNPYPPLGRKPRPAMLLIPDFSSSFPTPVLVARNPIAVAPPPPHPAAAAAAAATGSIVPSAAAAAAAAVAAAVPPVSVPFRSCHVASAAPQAHLLPQPIVRASRREFSGISGSWLSSSSSRAPPVAAPSLSVGVSLAPGWLHGATNPTAAAAGCAAATAARDDPDTLWQSSGVSSHHQTYNRQRQQQQQQQHQHRLQQHLIGAVTASSYEAAASTLNGSTNRRSSSCSRQQQHQQQEQYQQQPVVVQHISRDSTAAPPSASVPHPHLLQRQQHQHRHHHHNHRHTSSFGADEGLGLLCGVPQTCFVLGSILVALFSDAC